MSIPPGPEYNSFAVNLFSAYYACSGTQDPTTTALILQFTYSTIYLTLCGKNNFLGGVRTDGIVAYEMWHHFAIVRSGLVISLYISGDPMVSAAINSTSMSVAGPLCAGIVARASHSPIDMANARIVAGRAIYASAFAPPAQPLAVIPGTTLLIAALSSDSAFLDSSPNNVSISGTGTNWSSYSPFVCTDHTATSSATQPSPKTSTASQLPSTTATPLPNAKPEDASSSPNEIPTIIIITCIVALFVAAVAAFAVVVLRRRVAIVPSRDIPVAMTELSAFRANRNERTSNAFAFGGEGMSSPLISNTHKTIRAGGRRATIS